MIRKLIPVDTKDGNNSEICGTKCNDEVGSSKDDCKSMEIVDDFCKSDLQKGDEEDSEQNNRVSVGEEVWEDCGCVLWDLAANQTHAELMVLIYV